MAVRPYFKSSGVFGRNLIRTGVAAAWENDPMVIMAAQRAAQTGKEVPVVVGNQTLYIQPDGQILDNSPLERKLATGAKIGTMFAGGMAGGAAAAQGFGQTAGSYSPALTAETHPGVVGAANEAAGRTLPLSSPGSPGLPGSTTGLSGPIEGMPTFDPVTGASTLPSTTTVPSTGSLAGAANNLPSTSTVPNSTTTMPGGSPSGAVPGATGGGGIGGAISGVTNGMSTADWIKLGLAGASTVGGIIDARNNNRRSDEELALDQKRFELQQQQEARAAQAQFENEMLARAAQEAQERRQANANAYRASWYANRRPGPFNTAGYPPISAGYQQSLSALEQEALNRLSRPARYTTDQFPDLTNPTRSTNV